MRATRRSRRPSMIRCARGLCPTSPTCRPGTIAPFGCEIRMNTRSLAVGYNRRPSVKQLWRYAVAPIIFVVRFIAPESIRGPSDPPRANLDCLLGLCLYASLCVMLARLMPETTPHADQVFWLGMSLLFFPLSIRIAAPQVARSERIWFLLVLAEATFALKALTD